MFEMFGKIDRDKDGKIANEFPSWYFRTQIEELENDINRNEQSLEMGYVAEGRKGDIEERLRRDRERLDEINESIPKFNAVEKDTLAKILKDIGKEITTAMFRESDMKKGTADAYEEARRISTPCIEVKGDKEAAYYKSCNINISENGKVSRGGVEKAWKMGSRLLEEISNTEILRKS